MSSTLFCYFCYHLLRDWINLTKSAGHSACNLYLSLASDQLRSQYEAFSSPFNILWNMHMKLWNVHMKSSQMPLCHLSLQTQGQSPFTSEPNDCFLTLNGSHSTRFHGFFTLWMHLFDHLYLSVCFVVSEFVICVITTVIHGVSLHVALQVVNSA